MGIAVWKPAVVLAACGLVVACKKSPPPAAPAPAKPPGASADTNASNANANANANANSANGAAVDAGTPTTEINTGESSVETAAPSKATGCPATLPHAELLKIPGTVHRDYLSRNETWTLADSPHRLPSGITVQENITLTIEPCAVILLDTNDSINVNAKSAVVAVGDAQHPILISSLAESPQPGDWNAVSFDEQARASSKFAFTTLEYGGSDARTHESAGSLVSRIADGLELRDVTVQNFLGFGVMLQWGGTISANSARLTVRGGKVAADQPVAGAVGFESINAVRTLPEGSYTGNERDQITVLGGAGEVVSTTGTWRNAGVPYVLLNKQYSVHGTSSPVLTIAPGVTVAFGPDTALSIGNEGQEGGLIADGVDEKGRITFTTSSTEKAPGKWQGLLVDEKVLKTKFKLNFVSIEYAGAPGNACGCAPGDAESAQIAFVCMRTPSELGWISHTRFVGAPDNVAGVVGNENANTLDFTKENDFTQFAGNGCWQGPGFVNGSCESQTLCRRK